MKQVRVCLGRFQPFTAGHLKMATYKCKGPKTLQGFKGDINQKEMLREQPDIDDINKQTTVILCIETPADKVDSRHPFTTELMREEMNIIKQLPQIEDVLYVKSADICAWGELIKKAGYQASVWLTGSDEARPYVEMAMKVPDYEVSNRNNNDCKDAYTKSFYVESITRVERSEDITETISGTKVREALKNDDKETFKKMMPKETEHLFDKFKEALENAPEEKKKAPRKTIKEFFQLNMRSFEQMITEGGHVFNGGSDKIAKEDIKPTLDAYLKEIKRLFPKVWKYYENPQTLGSVGKKDFSGDIDIAVDEAGLKNVEDWNLDPQHITELYDKFKKRARSSTPDILMKRAVITAISEYVNANSKLIFTSDKSAATGSLYSQFNQIDHQTGKENGKTVQIDTMYGDVEWLKFAYYSDSYAGNVKGLHRTQLMLHMFRYKEHSFQHGRGVKNLQTDEWVAKKPEEAVKLLNDLYGFRLDQKTLQNYFKLQEFLNNHLSEKDRNGIYDIYLKTLDSTRCDIPEDLQAYWVENQERLGLKGSFLPDDSKLAPLRKDKR